MPTLKYNAAMKIGRMSALESPELLGIFRPRGKCPVSQESLGKGTMPTFPMDLSHASRS